MKKKKIIAPSKVTTIVSKPAIMKRKLVCVSRSWHYFCDNCALQNYIKLIQTNATKLINSTKNSLSKRNNKVIIKKRLYVVQI